ncbi:MAG: hypothetical protein ACJ0HB_00900 [Gammaproteobacteria bacterium]
MFFEEVYLFFFGLLFWLFWVACILVNLLSESKEPSNSQEEISEEDIYYDPENKIWLWEIDGHLFSNEEFHIQQGGKIKDFENWTRDKEPVDSIEDYTSNKIH